MGYKIKFQKQVGESPRVEFVLVFRTSEETKNNSDHFSPSELTNMTKNKIPIYYADGEIHSDDTVETIKLKIIQQIANVVNIPGISKATANELYLYGRVEETIYLETLKQYILNDNDGRNSVSYPYAYTILSNLNIDIDTNHFELDGDKRMTVNTLLRAIFKTTETNKDPFHHTRATITKSIGQHELFMRFGRKSISVAEPYLKWLQEDESVVLKPFKQNSYLLFETFTDTPKLKDDTILCSWLEESDDNKTDDFTETQIAWYYPDWKTKMTQEELKKKYASIRVVEELYSTYIPPEYKSPFIFGIEKFNITIRPVKTIKFPLYTIFKQLQTSPEHPLIKYNPRKTMRKIEVQNNDFTIEDDNEKGIIYKLYSDIVTVSNQKIPFLSKEYINAFILHKEVKSLSIYIYKLKYKDNHYYITCEIHHDGSVSVYSTYPNEQFPFSIQIDDMKNIINLALESALTPIHNILKKYYTFEFNDIYAQNVTVNSLSYKMTYNKQIRTSLKSPTHSNRFISELLGNDMRPKLGKNNTITNATGNKMVYAKTTQNREYGFPIIFESKHMSITKVNNVYYLPIFYTYFHALFYRLMNVNVKEPVSPIIEKNSIKSDVELNQDSDVDADSDVDSDVDASDDLINELEMFGGGKITEDKNPFVSKMKQIMPDLFKESIHSTDAKFKKYSRTCQNNEPLILTNMEKEKLVGSKKITDSTTQLLEYGKDNHGDSLYFTCPKYYCLKEGQQGVISEEDIKNGKCGPITDVSKAVFTNIKQRGNKYVYMPYDENTWFPGFNSSRLQNGFCSPCCFKKIGNAQLEKKKECTTDTDTDRDTDKNKGESNRVNDSLTAVSNNLSTSASMAKSASKTQNPDDNLYILGSESNTPISERRWAYLPTIIQTFLNNSNSVCTQQENPSLNTSFNFNCFLRYGVEISNTKSFLAVISNIMYYKNTTSRVLSVAEMSQYLVEHITIDDFMLAQNGNLFAVFNSKTQKDDDMSKIDKAYQITDIKTKYKSKLFSDMKVSTSDIHVYDFIQQLIHAFENFRRFITDPKSHVDYTYLWDILCTPNPHFFIDGMNLCILETTEDKSEVNLVCPTNPTSAAFDTSKPTYLMLKSHNHFFEPIYLHKTEFLTKKQMIQNIRKSFILANSPSFIKDVIHKVIIPTFKECSITNSKQLNITQLLSFLTKHSDTYTISTQTLVINYVGQVIGVRIQLASDSVVGFIPCIPSTYYTPITNTYPQIIFMDELKVSSYADTITFYKTLTQLNNIKETGKYEIVQIINDKKKVIGLYVKNYEFFIPLLKPVKPTSESFTLEENKLAVDTYNANLQTQLALGNDQERVDYVKRMQLESKFYNIFKNTLRDLVFNDSSKYDALYKECTTDELVLYSTQLNRVKKLLEDVGDKTIWFTRSDKLEDYSEYPIQNIQTCFRGCDVNFCKCVKNPTNTCQLILPKYNLISSTNNKTLYYTKFADELIRFKNISQIFFNKKQFVLFQSLATTNKSINEILIFESQLLYKNKEYLKNIKNMREMHKNLYVKNTTYDSSFNKGAPPTISYNEQINQNKESNGDIESRDCTGPPTQLSSTFLLKTSQCLKNPNEYQEFQYKNYPDCGLSLITDLVYIFFQESISVSYVRHKLIEIYNALMFTKPMFKNVIKILNSENQSKKGVALVKSGAMKISDMILSEDYYPVIFDLWLLLNHFKIPSMFISTLTIPEAERFENKKMFIAYDSPDKKYVFINVPAMHRNWTTLPVYRLISKQTKSDVLARDLTTSDVLVSISNCVVEPHSPIAIEQYVQNYNPYKNPYIPVAQKKLELNKTKKQVRYTNSVSSSNSSHSSTSLGLKKTKKK